MIGRNLFMIAGVFVLFLFLTAEAPPLTKGDALAGKRNYDRHCALCHGKKGEGMGPSLKMSNFASKEYQASRTDQELFDRISKGIPGTGMPSWEKKLEVQPRWDIFAYLRTLGPR